MATTLILAMTASTSASRNFQKQDVDGTTVYFHDRGAMVEVKVL